MSTCDDVLLDVEERGTRSLVLKFKPEIKKVTMGYQKRSCVRKGTTDDVMTVSSTTCPDGYALKDVAENAYGIKDISKTKLPFQLTIGETALNANLAVNGAVSAKTNIGGVVEATADLDATLTGSMALKVNPASRGYISFTEWLADITAIKTPSREEGFFDVSAVFEGSISASATTTEPFQGLTASVTGTMEAYNIDFLASTVNKPKFNLEINLPTIGNVKDMSFDEVVELLSKALEFLVGDEEDKEEALKSCSGGLLGKEIAGEKVFQYQLPLLGLSACESASNLKTIVAAVEELKNEVANEANSTFSALENKLTALLTDAIGGAPTVDIVPSDSAAASNLDIDIVLNYVYERSGDLFIDLQSILETSPSTGTDADAAIVSVFSNSFFPNVQGDGSTTLAASLKATLSVGLEYDKSSKTVEPYLRGSTGLEATLYADTQFGFDASIGPFKGSADGTVNVGSSTSPITLSATLSGGRNEKHFITDLNTVSSIGEKIDISFQGSVVGQVNAEVDDLFFPTGVPKLEASIQCPDLIKAIKRESGACSTALTTYGPPSLQMPSFFDMLLADPQGIVDGIDDILVRVEKATVGADGIITNFPAPMIQKAVGDALGAGKEDNIIAYARTNVVQALQERLDGYDKDTDENAPGTVAAVLAQEMQRLLDNDIVDLIATGQTVTVSCYKYDTATQKQIQLSTCTDGDPTSLMWTVPFGQEYTIELDLDFALEVDSFPLAMELSGGSNSPTLSISWEFTLGFGFDEKEGFFLSSEVQDVAENERKSELKVQAWFNLENKSLDAQLFFLKASMADLDINVAAGVFVDIVKPAKLDKAGPMKGRVSRSDMRKLNRASDIFEISAVAGATIETPLKTSVDFHDLEVAKYIPKLEGNVAVQARKEFSSGARRLVRDADRRRLQENNASHPMHWRNERASGMFRWLAGDPGAKAILETNFGSNWEKCPVSGTQTTCAFLTGVKLDVKSIKEAIQSITRKLVNTDGSGEPGYIDKVVEPLVPLNEPIPGLSDLTGDETSVLDLADVLYPKSGAGTVKRVLEMYEDLKTFVNDLEDSDYIELADKCDMLNGLQCTGGEFTSTARDLQEAEEMPLILLPGQNATSTGQASTRALATSNEDCSQITNKRKRVFCKANKVEGLSFPFLANPKDALKLLQGEDIVLVEFTPPEITFGFYKDFDYLLYPLPTVTLGVYFEFSTRFKYGLSMDTKGIREAVMQNEPSKAFNSFALMDKFDDVDEPLLTFTAAVGFDVSVRAIIVRASVSGGIRIQAVFDLYDPYPDTSNGLVRPYEMLSVSSDPTQWMEYSVSMNLELAISIEIGIFWWIFEFILYEYTASWSIELVSGSTNTPEQPVAIVECDTETGVMTLKEPGQSPLSCTGLGGEISEEKIECILATRDKTHPPIQSCDDVKKVSAASSTSAVAEVILRDIKSSADITNFGNVGSLVLDYADTSKITKSLISVQGSEARVGSSVVEFSAAVGGEIFLPEPEIPKLTTSFDGDCNTKWELHGYTNVEIKASQIGANCDITAQGGVGESDLFIDFAPFGAATCGNGNYITVNKGVNYGETKLTINKVGGVTKGNEIIVGKQYRNINIVMTDCTDEVEITGTADRSGTIVVTTKGGDDIVTVGGDTTGTDEIYKKVIVHGGKGRDTLIANDFGGFNDKYKIELRSAVLNELLNGAHRYGGSTKLNESTTIRKKQQLVFDKIDELNIKLSGKRSALTVTATPPKSQTKIIGKAGATETKVCEMKMFSNLVLEGVEESCDSSSALSFLSSNGAGPSDGRKYKITSQNGKYLRGEGNDDIHGANVNLSSNLDTWEEWYVYQGSDCNGTGQSCWRIKNVHHKNYLSARHDSKSFLLERNPDTWERFQLHFFSDNNLTNGSGSVTLARIESMQWNNSYLAANSNEDDVEQDFENRGTIWMIEEL